MTANIKSSVPGNWLRIETLRSGLLEFTFNGGPEWARDVTRADLLAAVEAECGVRLVPADAIVIDQSNVERETLIDAICSRTAYSASSRLDRGNVGNAVDAIYRALAPVPPTPPVDEADVEALAGLVDEAGVRVVPNASSRLIARRLLDTGRVSVTR